MCILNDNERKRNIIAVKAGGNSSKNSYNYKISLPSKWIHEMGLSHNNKECIIVFEGNKIIIEAV